MRNRITSLLNEIKKAFSKRRLEIRMAEFKKLTEQDKGWALYIMLIRKYIAQCRKIKADINLATASDDIKKRLEHMEIEVATLEWAIRIPERTINKVLIEQKKEEEDNLLKEIETEIAKERNEQ